MKSKESKILHDKAIDIVDEAELFRRKGNLKRYIELTKEAFQLEKQAALQLEEEVNCEPTRSVLFRSAGWLAFNAGLFSEALDMAVRGKRFCVHTETQEELEELYILAKKNNYNGRPGNHNYKENKN